MDARYSVVHRRWYSARVTDRADRTHPCQSRTQRFHINQSHSSCRNPRTFQDKPPFRRILQLPIGHREDPLRLIQYPMRIDPCQPSMCKVFDRSALSTRDCRKTNRTLSPRFPRQRHDRQTNKRHHPRLLCGCRLCRSILNLRSRRSQIRQVKIRVCHHIGADSNLLGQQVAIRDGLIHNGSRIYLPVSSPSRPPPSSHCSR